MTSQKVGRIPRSISMDGQASGTGLSSGNPAAERRLATALSKIDREKKKRELAMVWNQRSFFIKQVFDQDNELRFVKAARRPKYLENIPPPPPDGDNSWEKEDYVFSFKPKRTGSSVTYGGRMGRRRSKETLEEVASKAVPRPSEIAVVAEAQAAEKAAQNEAKARAEAEEQVRKAEEERLEKEKRDRSMGAFGSRREKLKMPVLMGGAKSSPESDKAKDEAKIVDGSKVDEVDHIEETVGDTKDEDDDPLNQSKSSGSGSIEATKPKTRFPVLKVRALGLFAMTFKKSNTFPPLQGGSKQSSESSPQDNQSPDVVGSLPPPSAASVTSGSVPPQTAPTTSGSGVADADIVIEPFPRPGSISLPNSPLTQRKPMVRQKSANAIQLGDLTERLKTEQPRTNTSSSKRIDISASAASGRSSPRKSRRGSRRDLTSGQANDKLRRAMCMSSDGTSPPKDTSDKHRRSLSSEKGISLPSAKSGGSSSALPKVKRDASAKPSTAAASVKSGPHGSTTPGPGAGTPLPEASIQNLWAKLPDASESRNRGQENKDGSIPVDDLEGDAPPSDDVDVQVIRRIIRTLPSNLMMKTSKREAEAGGEYAIFRQRLMDRAKADMTRKAALDPRFMKLEKSLCNSGNK